MKINVGSTSYRTTIRHLLGNQKVSLSKISEEIGIQKSYLSRVLNGQGDLNNDQIYLISCFFNLSEIEEEFLTLQLEIEKTSIAEKRKILSHKLNKIKSELNKTEKHLHVNDEKNLDQYYLDPLNQLVHIALGINNMDEDKLCNMFSISKSKLKKVLASLEKMEIIVKEKKHYKVIQKSIHLPKNSLLFWPWRTQLKNLSEGKCIKGEENKHYNFSVVFSSDERTRELIHQEYLHFLSKVESIVRPSPAEGLYQINFDLIDWN